MTPYRVPAAHPFQRRTRCHLSHCAQARHVISGLNCKTRKRGNRSERHTSVQSVRLQCSPFVLSAVFSLSTFRQKNILDVRFAAWTSAKLSRGWFSAFTDLLQDLRVNHLHPSRDCFTEV